MKILLSNDDGVNAKGINYLYDALIKIGEVNVIAPDRNRSGASNSLTLDSPLRPHKLPNGFTSLEGTPTDCIHLALTGYIDYKPDMVVSGINDGANLGDDVLYSGTVAAAMEARILGIPSIAVSLVTNGNYHYKTAAMIAQFLVQKLQFKPFPAATILNVNVPDILPSEIKGFQVARLGTRHTAGHLVKDVDPRGKEIFWVGPAGAGDDSGIGTDFNAVQNGYVSITPLQVDLTHYSAFERVSDWIKNFDIKNIG